MNLKEAINMVDSESILSPLSEGERDSLQKILIEMYTDILATCQKYNIVPYLGGGSALGAIRHKGFIPWDDDVDINMTRSDFEIFKSIFEKELSEKYILNAPNFSETPICRFPKVYRKGTTLIEAIGSTKPEFQRVYIDIFLIENVPRNKLHRFVKGIFCNALEYVGSRVALYQDSNELQNKILKLTGKRYYIDRIIGFVFSPIKASQWNNYIDKSVRYKKETGICNFPTGRKHYFGEICEKERLFPETYVPFESISAPVFSGYDYYLKNLYGDYMEVPPIDKREQHYIKELKL